MASLDRLRAAEYPEFDNGESVTIQLWLDSQINRRLSLQQVSRNRSLVIVIFTEGIAAALVGSALQLGEHQRLLLAARSWFHRNLRRALP